MPFFEPVKCENKIECVSLQVHKPFSHIENNTEKISHKKKRVCLFASRGSITVEAAIVTSVFMMAVIFVEGFIMMLNTEMTMQINLNNTAKSVAKKMLYAQAIDEMSEYNRNIAYIKKIIKEKLKLNDNEENEDFNKNIDKGFIMAELYFNMKDNLPDNFHISGGVLGIKLTESSLENGNVDIVAEYKIKMPFVNKYFAIKQRAYLKDWTGKDITQTLDTVYITKTGVVYHKKKDCKYLALNIKKVTFGQINTIRNNSGEKYKKCKYCAGNEPGNSKTIYITDDGTRYHYSLECGGLTRSIIPTDISKIGDRRPCSNCGQGE